MTFKVKLTVLSCFPTKSGEKSLIKCIDDEFNQYTLLHDSVISIEKGKAITALVQPSNFLFCKGVEK